MDKPKPTFSVLVCTYNRAHLLRRAIHSVLAQTDADFELLVVDDNSSDDTSKVVEEFSDERIVYIKRPVNGGSSAARNTGIGHASGRYIAFLDDDDEYLSDFLARTRHAFSTIPTSVGATFCRTLIVETTHAEERVIGERVPTAPPLHDRERAVLFVIRKQPLSSGWGFTIRAELFERVGLFDESLPAAVDWDLFIRMARHCDFHVIPQVLIRQHKHGGPQLTKPSPQRYRARAQILKKHLEAFRASPEVHHELCCNIGLLYYRAGDKQLARHELLGVLRRAPLYLRTWRRLVVGEAIAAFPQGLQPRIWRLLTRPRKPAWVGSLDV
jgi:glycosyltransferase involved in cell wall biosynthesis